MFLVLFGYAKEMVEPTSSAPGLQNFAPIRNGLKVSALEQAAVKVGYFRLLDLAVSYGHRGPELYFVSGGNGIDTHFGETHVIWHSRGEGRARPGILF